MDFNIIDSTGKNMDACAQFIYKGRQVSISTIGRSQGACASPVAVFTGHNFQTMVGEFYSVEEAIYFINGDSTIINIRYNN